MLPPRPVFLSICGVAHTSCTETPRSDLPRCIRPQLSSISAIRDIGSHLAFDIGVVERAVQPAVGLDGLGYHSFGLLSDRDICFDE